MLRRSVDKYHTGGIVTDEPGHFINAFDGVFLRIFN